eukprot:SM000139S00089  [mRNA]  locus=s139:71615:75400:+ [translate_table: standard]
MKLPRPLPPDGKAGKKAMVVPELKPSVPSAADLAKKKVLELGARTWMRIGEDGGAVVLDADKYAIMHRVGIHARDLRLLDPLLPNPSSILGRERAMVLNLEVSLVDAFLVAQLVIIKPPVVVCMRELRDDSVHIKAIITADEDVRIGSAKPQVATLSLQVLLRNPTDDNVIPFIEELRRRLPVRQAGKYGLAYTPDGSEEEEAPVKGSPGNGGHAADEDADGEHVLAASGERTSEKQGHKLRCGDFDDFRFSANCGMPRTPCLAPRHEPGSTVTTAIATCAVRHGPDMSLVGSSVAVPPFEFRALEVVLEAVCSFLDARTTELENAAYPALDELTSKISSLNLERVRKLKTIMTRLTGRVQKVREELEQLLDDDDDMRDMFLTRKLLVPGSPGASVGVNWAPPSPTIGSRVSRGGASRASTISTLSDVDDDVEELEMLLESYFVQVDSTLNKLSTLREYIDDTEDYINIQLELILNTATMVVGIFTAVTGIFGMNIPYDWNDDPSAFAWVIIVSTAGCLASFFSLVGYARYRRLIT